MDIKLLAAVVVIIVLVVIVVSMFTGIIPDTGPSTAVRSQEDVTETITGVISDIEDLENTLDDIDTSLG